MAQILLHGTLHITIFEAASLVNESRVSGAAPKFLRKMVENAEDSVGFGKGSSALYATIDLEKQRVGRTRIIRKEPTRPVWNESFHISCAHNLANIVVSVKDDLTVSAFLLGRAKVPVTRVMTGEPVEGWFELFTDAGAKLGNSRVRLRIQFFEVSRDHHWGKGLIDASDYEGVPYTYFPQRKGCLVTLYQDAHMPDNFLPRIFLRDGAFRQPTRCWEDIYEAIVEAQHFIYITGWSVYTEIKLIRDRSRGPQCDLPVDLTLGELLKKKASDGVRVVLLVWDDRTSMSMVKMEGLMATHDEETFNYFRGSDVKCLLCPRNPDSGLSYVKGFQIGSMFTHHQKSVIVDAPHHHGGRRVVSFVGGIDLCDGRYDTQFHPLFRTLGTVHKDDFHQPNYVGAMLEKGGPREPWHDIHSKLEGPVAWDVLYNFEQRWNKQGDGKHHLFDTKQLGPPEPVTRENDPAAWNVQIFRSIDGGAAADFPEDPVAASAAGLVSGKDATIDRSIQDAYIQAIRRAKDFIYIENQYFLGSSYAWDSDSDAEAHHVIPRELALKVVRKIEAGERFAVYIVLPMWPEGVPESGQVLAILDWQKKTMQMMYKLIAQALHARGLYDVSPKEYLNFYCLGNRETRLEGEYLPPGAPDPSATGYKSAQDNRRFMIYVHSKMMIVDDEYIIVGSANINQRSMDGGRDTEIAMGAYQPYHTLRNPPVRGEIHGFRMALWYEHTGMLDDVFLQPWSLDCVRKVNRTADQLWQMFAGDEVVDLPGHLLTYPVGVTNDGYITELPGCSTFRDTDAKIVGVRSDYFPPILTT